MVKFEIPNLIEIEKIIKKLFNKCKVMLNWFAGLGLRPYWPSALLAFGLCGVLLNWF